MGISRHSRTGHAVSRLLLIAGGLLWLGTAQAAHREFWITIEQVTLHVAPHLDYQVYAFNGQVPGPLIHVKEGDRVTVHVKNDTGAMHTIHWHGLYNLGKDWRSDGVPGITEAGIQPGHTETYEWTAEKAGTLWYHCHNKVEDHIALRGMWGPLIIDPKDQYESPVEKQVTKTAILMMSGWQSKVAQEPTQGGAPGTYDDYFSINGKSFPLDQPIRVKHGDVLSLRLINPAMQNVSMHLHGHDMLIVRRDGRLLKSPYWVDTIQLTSGERYEAIVFCNHTEGRFIFHDHIDKHATNAGKYPGGIITVLEYNNGKPHDKWYPWHDIKYNPDFFYQQDMKKPYGMYDNPAFKGKGAAPESDEKFKGDGLILDNVRAR